MVLGQIFNFQVLNYAGLEDNLCSTKDLYSQIR